MADTTLSQGLTKKQDVRLQVELTQHFLKDLLKSKMLDYK